jgi:Fe-S oxidoreductase
MTANLRLLATDPGRPRLSFGDYEDSAITAYTAGHRIATRKSDETALFQDAHRTDLSPQTRQPTIRVEPPAVSPGGFARAVEMCNGAGVCRQRVTGTMCPSFMVTRDEAHSTRGRANALRAAMTGALPPGEMTGPEMHAIMDLCISCKACKAECPSSVDMARLKTEFLARYHDVHGIPSRTRFFGHSAALNQLGSGRAAPLAGFALRSSAGRRAQAWLGLAPQRPLPLPARRPFRAWWAQYQISQPSPSGIILFVDPFTDALHPEVAIAAVELFAALGVPIGEAIVLDDGRACISKGLISPARRAAGRVMGRLAPAAAAGHTIVGLEPSSLLTLRDEYHYLLPGDARVASVARAALTFEEFVAALADRSDLTGFFTPERRGVLLHGHCHQKALVGTASARRALSLPAGYTVEEVDSGCCGMAGSFGYEAEHYDISMQMAERRLLPAVRAAAPETIIAAAGLSCRQQIAHGSGRTALHPAQILRAALADTPHNHPGESL